MIITQSADQDTLLIQSSEGIIVAVHLQMVD